MQNFENIYKQLNFGVKRSANLNLSISEQEELLIRVLPEKKAFEKRCLKEHETDKEKNGFFNSFEINYF